MVVGFAKDNMHLTESDLAKLAIDIREGDISVVLKEYEKEIKVKRNMNKSFLLLTHSLLEPFKECHSW